MVNVTVEDLARLFTCVGLIVLYYLTFTLEVKVNQLTEVVRGLCTKQKGDQDE